MSPITLKHLTLRTILGYALLALILGSLFVYIAYQARFIIGGPAITIFTEAGMHEERTVVLEGQVSNVVSVSLNGRRIYTDGRGYFKETLVLENGYTIATVEAQDRYGRIERIDRSFIYAPALSDNS